MRRNTILALALVLVALLAGSAWLLVGEEVEHAPLATSNRAAADDVAPALDPASLADSGASASAVSDAVRAQGAVERAARGPRAQCTVRGRLVDEHGAPIAGAAVRLFAEHSWADDVAAPRLAGRGDLRGFETATDAAGEFRITAPVPTAQRTVLAILPDRFHEAVTRVFAEAGERVSPALVPGDRDLGELRVASTGALTGRVLDAQGQPVADVELGIGDARDVSFERDTRTDAEGRYRIAHAPVGTYGVHARSPRHLDAFEPGIIVAPGVDTAVRDLVLALAPTLAGRVVDEHGKPLADARLSALALDDGRESCGASEADGRFEVALRADVPHVLWAELDGYARWGTPHDRANSFAPGSRDIAVVLRALPRMRFKVVDADGSAPIERFGLAIVPDESATSTSAHTGAAPHPRLADHPGGIVETGARAGLDLVAVEAAGCVPWLGRVRFDAPDVPLQTVRLSRGAAIVGRALREDAALADTLVDAARITSFALRADGTYDSVRHEVDGESRRGARTDGEGRFHITGLQGGDYRLTVRPASGAVLVLAPVHVPPRATTDVGDLDVVAGGTIVGELLAPDGVDTAGLRAVLDDPDDGVTAFVDGAGRFRFENVPAGVRFVGYEPRAGTLAPLEPVRVELAAGATESVTLDARANAVCAVDLQIELGEFAAAGVQVELVPADGAGRSEPLGSCDATGRVHGAVRAFGAARVGVHLTGAGLTLHPAAVLELKPLGHVAAAVKFEFARLELRLRGALPRDGRVTVRLAPRVDGLGAQSFTLRFANGSAVAESGAVAARADGVSIGGLGAGPWTVTVEVFAADPEPTYTATTEIELVAGRVLALEL